MLQDCKQWYRTMNWAVVLLMYPKNKLLLFYFLEEKGYYVQQNPNFMHPLRLDTE